MPKSSFDSISDPQLSRRRDSWSRYWQSGMLHSCPGSFAGNYDGSIRAFWHHAFAPLQSGQRVLDVATGNGALPQLLLNHTQAHSAGCRIDAVDLAEIAPTWVAALDEARRSRLHLHSGVRAEALPFADDSFHLVISQYGLEYADLPQALGEVARVLSPGGRLRLLMHHHDSVSVMRAAAELPMLTVLCGTNGLISLASRLLPWVVLAATPAGREQLQNHPEALKDREHFNACQIEMDRLVASADEAADAVHEARQQIQQIFVASQTQGAQAGLDLLMRMQDAYSEHLLRTQELIDCALDSEAIAELLHLLDALGFAQAHAVPIYYGTHLMGWTLQADLV